VKCHRQKKSGHIVRSKITDIYNTGSTNVYNKYNLKEAHVNIEHVINDWHHTLLSAS
jgi:hypothetical protein